MTESEYNRVANRGIAAGVLTSMMKMMEEFRWAAESAGIHVNEGVIAVKDQFDAWGQEMQKHSFSDRAELER